MCSCISCHSRSIDATELLDMVRRMFCSVGTTIHFPFLSVDAFRTLVTHSFIEIHIWHTVIDVVVVFLYSKMIEPLWGTKELLQFFFIVTIPNALFAAGIYFLLYGLTFNEEYLFERPIYGLAAFIGAYSVVIKQIMPDTVLANTPLFKLKQDQVPLLIVLFSIGLWVVKAVPIHFVIMLSFGILISWTYLRSGQPRKDTRQHSNIYLDSFKLMPMALRVIPQRHFPLLGNAERVSTS